MGLIMTSKTQGKNRLRDAEILLAILDHMPTSIFAKDENLNFVYSNELHCEMIGKTEEDLLGKRDSDFYPAADAEQFLANDQKVLTEGLTVSTEEIARNQRGQTIPVVTRKARLRTSDGRTFLIGTTADLTELRKREDQYKALAETVPVGIVQISESGRVIFSNPLFHAYCGGDNTAETAKRVIDKVTENHAGFPGIACRFETEIQSLGEEPRSVIIISSGWLYIGAEERAAIVSVVDISAMTELRRVNAEISRLNRELADNMGRLKAAQDELVKKGKMEQLGQLTATVAHELRNPLGAVRTSAYLLERKVKGHVAGVESQFERINNGIKRCDNTITQLLDFSRTKGLTCEPRNLDQWLSQVVTEQVSELPAVLTVHVNLGLNDAEVPFDPARLQRAVVNIIANAAEAMTDPRLGPQQAIVNPTITISSSPVNKGVALVFKDNGPGMPAEVLERVREPLFTTKSFGTGLGIPAVEQIAIQHGGTLDITSKVGEGSCFTIWLPIKAEQRVA